MWMRPARQRLSRAQIKLSMAGELCMGIDPKSELTTSSLRRITFAMVYAHTPPRHLEATDFPIR